jgi:hypothetical protein
MRDAFEVIDSLGKYDMIVLGDVLEHFEKEKARQLLDKCVAHTNGHIIISIPLGAGWNQPEIYGNPHQIHLSCWQSEEFEPFASNRKFVEFEKGLYGIFLVGKGEYLDYKIRTLKTLTESQWQNPDIDLRKLYRLDKKKYCGYRSF